MAPPKKRATPVRRTPAQRAEADLGVAVRTVKRLEAAATKLRVETEAVEKELTAAKRRRDYLAMNPDLPTTTGATPHAAQAATQKGPES